MAMRVAERLLVDTNILLEATDEKRLHHHEARQLIESYRGLVVPAQVIREYLVVTTRPAAANGLGMSVTDALANVREFHRAIRLLPESKPLLPTLLRLLAAVPCSGTRIHDAHIVASAVVHKIKTIVSLNTDDFALFAPRINAITPRVARERRTPPSAHREARRTHGLRTRQPSDRRVCGTDPRTLPALFGEALRARAARPAGDCARERFPPADVLHDRARRGSCARPR